MAHKRMASWFTKFSCKFEVEFIVQSNCHWSASTITLLYAAIKNVQVDGQTSFQFAMFRHVCFVPDKCAKQLTMEEAIQ